MNLHEEVCFTSFSVYILIYIYYSLLHDNPKSVSTGNKCVQEGACTYILKGIISCSKSDVELSLQLSLAIMRDSDLVLVVAIFAEVLL